MQHRMSHSRGSGSFRLCRSYFRPLNLRVSSSETGSGSVSDGLQAHSVPCTIGDAYQAADAKLFRYGMSKLAAEHKSVECGITRRSIARRGQCITREKSANRIVSSLNRDACSARTQSIHDGLSVFERDL